MALAYEDKYNIAYPAPAAGGFPSAPHKLKKQVVAAMQKAASNILIEDVMTQYHQDRLRFVTQVRNASEAFINSVLWIVLNDVNVENALDPTSISDATIAGIVDGTPNLLLLTNQI